MKQKLLFFFISALFAFFAAVLFFRFGTPVFLYILKKPQPLVSVVLPTYNRVRLLPRAVESVLKQTYKNFELIIVNDGSSDNTASYLNTLSAKDPRIKIVTNPTNKGVAYSRQNGLDHALGKYVAIMDDDDIVLPIWLETAVAFMEKNTDVIVAYPDRYLFNKSIADSKLIYPSLNPWLLRFNNVIHNMGNLIRRDFIVQHNIRYSSDIGLGEDYDFWLQILMNFGKIRKISIPLAIIARQKNFPAQYKGRWGVPQARDKFEKFLFPENMRDASECQKWLYLKKVFINEKEILPAKSLKSLILKECSQKQKK